MLSKIGPNMKPCGTPYKKIFKILSASFNLTSFNLSKNIKMLSFAINKSLRMQSNASEKSMYISYQFFIVQDAFQSSMSLIST